jgi:hypothetical protein
MFIKNGSRKIRSELRNIGAGVMQRVARNTTANGVAQISRPVFAFSAAIHLFLKCRNPKFVMRPNAEKRADANGTSKTMFLNCLKQGNVRFASLYSNQSIG